MNSMIAKKRLPDDAVTHLGDFAKVFCFQEYRDQLQGVHLVSDLGVLAGAEPAHILLDAGKKTVRELSESPLVDRRRMAPPKAVALLERWKGVPSVDPRLLRVDNERLFDTAL